MTLEKLAQANDVSMWSAARAMINLIRRGLVEPSQGTPEEAIADLTKTMEAYQPGAR